MPAKCILSDVKDIDGIFSNNILYVISIVLL